MKDIRPALRELMLQSSDVANSVTSSGNARIYPTRLPQGITLTSIVYTLISESITYTMEGQTRLVQARFQIDCWSPTINAAAVLSNAVNEQLSGFFGTITYGSNSPLEEVTIPGIFHGQGREGYDQESKMSLFSREYFVWYHDRTIPPPDPPVNVVLPSVAGTTTFGSTIVGTDGTYTGTEPITLEYRWLRALTFGGIPIGAPGAWLGTIIAGADGPDHTMEGDDAGEILFREERATNIAGSTGWISSSNYIGPMQQYVGPGDIVSGATIWWGLRAYSSNTVGDPCVRLIRASDSAEQDFVTLVDGSLDTFSVDAFLAATTGKIKTIYDQTGNGHHATQATDAARPVYVASGIGSLPVSRHAGGQELDTAASYGSAVAQPVTLVAVAKRTGDFSGFGFTIAGPLAAPWLAFSNAANTVELMGGATGTAAALDNVWHALIGMLSGAASKIYVDGAVSTVNAGAVGMQDQIMDYGHLLTGDLAEAGFWPSGFDAAQAADMTTNQQTYWGI